MPEDRSPEKDHSIPPPLDPFPTYQTPYPRSDKDNENPFIQFRRFADDQFSSFLHGLHRMLGFPPRKDVDDMMRQRQEWQEGWRKQVEQEMEEMRQMLQASKGRSESMERLRQNLESTTPEGPESKEEGRDKMRQHQLEIPKDVWTRLEDASRPPQDTTPWWTRGAAARCPALNGTESQGNSSKCPALYDDNGQPKTELDAYEALPNISNANDMQVFQAPVQDILHQQSKSWFSSFGWDGRQKKEAWGDDQGSKDGDDQALARPARPTTYTMFGSRRMDPFNNTDDTIPWLLLSKYSPVYLCNPSQPRLFKVRIQDAEGVPFQISRPRFFERWYTEADEKLAKQLPWADAFEDLLSLQQTGKMVGRDYRDCATWRTPATWIHDMVHRGSLGSRWGFNQDSLLMKRFDETNTLQGSSHIDDHCKWRKERRWGCRRHNEEKQSTTPSLGLTEKEEDFIDDMIDKATEPLAPFPIFGSVLSAADSIVSAVEAAREEFEKAQSTPEKQFQPEQSQTLEDAPAPVLSTSSSSSYSYESSFLSSGQSTDSVKHVVATTTSTTERTLPDGSVETRRTYKRRFADGTEESDESVEVRNIPRAFPSPLEESAIIKQTRNNEEPTVLPTSPERFDHTVPMATRPDSDDTPLHDPLKDDLYQQSQESAPLQHDSQSEGDTTHQQNRDRNGNRRSGRGGWFWT
ncbi:hypothetical protein LTR67_002305 [Exophiala xenobiotica]